MIHHKKSFSISRFHVARYLSGTRSQMMWKCGEKKKVAYVLIAECVTDVEVLCTESCHHSFKCTLINGLFLTMSYRWNKDISNLLLVMPFIHSGLQLLKEKLMTQEDFRDLIEHLIHLGSLYYPSIFLLLECLVITLPEWLDNINLCQLIPTFPGGNFT